MQRGRVWNPFPGTVAHVRKILTLKMEGCADGAQCQPAVGVFIYWKIKFNPISTPILHMFVVCALLKKNGNTDCSGNEYGSVCFEPPHVGYEVPSLVIEQLVLPELVEPLIH